MTKVELQDKLKEMDVAFPEDATIQQLRTLYFSILKGVKEPEQSMNDLIEDRSELKIEPEPSEGLVLIKKLLITTEQTEADIRTLKLYIIGVLVVSIALSATIFLIFRKKL